MTKFKDYNQTINTLKQIGVNHKQIQNVNSGDIWEIDLEKNTLFPLMFINPVNAVFGEKTTVMNFQIFVMDLVYTVQQQDRSATATSQNQDQIQEQTVLSDCLQICQDIISTFKTGEALYHSNIGINEDAAYFIEEGDITIEPFTERFDNAAVGWVFTIPVLLMNDYQTCNIPSTTDYAGK